MYSVIKGQRLGFEVFYIVKNNALLMDTDNNPTMFMSLQYAIRKAYMLNNGRK